MTDQSVKDQVVKRSIPLWALLPTDP